MEMPKKNLEGVGDNENECDFAKMEKPEIQSGPEKIKLAFLPPDHPLLQKFQETLREYLLRSKQQLSTEIAELKYNIKLKEQQREEHGAKLYEMQQEIRHQNEQLEDYAIEIQGNLKRRHDEDEEVNKLKAIHEEKLALSKEYKFNYNKRMVELDNLQTLQNNLRKWTDEVEDEVKNAKRVVSRDSQLQKQLSEEKKKSDMLFYHLDVEVKKREKELVDVSEELASQREVIGVLNQSISYANADLEALQNEHKHLTQAWGEVIVAINHRDKIMHQVNESRQKEKEFIKLSTLSIEAAKKQITKELYQNDKLQAFKTRLANDFASLKRECQKESDTLTKLESKLEEIPLLLEQTEKDLHEAKKEGNQLEIQLRRIQWKIDKQNNKKYQLEENILKLAQEQLITDKANSYRLKLINNAQDQRRVMELNLAQTENQLAETLLELEKHKGQLFKMNQDNEILKQKQSAVEQKFDHLTSELKTLENQIIIKMKRIEKLNHQLDLLLTESEGAEISPTERKIKLLEKSLHEAEMQIREFQQFWLMLQNHFVNLSQKRNNQLNEIQVTRKQLSIIKQKSLKIDNDLEKSEETTRDLKRDIKLYTSKVEQLNEKMFKKVQQHESDENECELEHFDLLQKLKDNEIKVLELEAEIDDLETDIEYYKDLVLDKHREALSWETKYKLIEETLRWQKGEKSLDSEIGNMKMEIHRMQIRYNQLKKAQEKLVQDLEHCILHREQIFIAASAKQRADAKPHKSKASTSSHQKINDLRNKLKQVQNEISTLTDEDLVEVNREYESIHNVIKKISEDIEQETKQEKLIRNEIEESALLKHRNLEEIVRKQNRAKNYRRLNNTNLPLKIPRSETTLQINATKQNEINDSLVEIIQTLISEFPERKNFFSKILQTLKD